MIEEDMEGKLRRSVLGGTLRANMSLHATVKRKARTTNDVTRDKLPCGN